jgi:hypothetical protein
MGEKVKIILITTLVFFISFAIFQIYSPDKFIIRLFKKTGTLRVEAQPKASVFLEGKLIGQTPLQTSVSAGTYNLKLISQTESKKYLPYIDRIKISSNIMTFVNYEFAKSELSASGEKLTMEKTTSRKGQLLVSTNPENLFVLFDGEERGLSPLLMDGINPGEHELTVSGEGMLTRSIKIEITQGYKLLAEFKMAVDPQYQKKKEEEKKKTEEDKVKGQKLEIKNTETGWLRVRSQPDLNASESAKVNSLDKFTYYNEMDGWYEIEYEKGKKGWVNGEYVTVME